MDGPFDRRCSQGNPLSSHLESSGSKFDSAKKSLYEPGPSDRKTSTDRIKHYQTFGLKNDMITRSRRSSHYDRSISKENKFSGRTNTLKKSMQESYFNRQMSPPQKYLPDHTGVAESSPGYNHPGIIPPSTTELKNISGRKSIESGFQHPLREKVVSPSPLQDMQKFDEESVSRPSFYQSTSIWAKVSKLKKVLKRT